jgi:hypothetical protein
LVVVLVFNLFKFFNTHVQRNKAKLFISPLVINAMVAIYMFAVIFAIQNNIEILLVLQKLQFSSLLEWKKE